MDAKDLRIESTPSDRNNDSSKYSQSGGVAVHCERNKAYQDIGSNSLSKVEVQGARPCAVIGPDRVVPPTVSNESYLKKHPEPWQCIDNAYHYTRRPPEYPHKLSNFENPTRNISPRQTFQENMQRIMVPPSYRSVKINDDGSYTQMTDKNNVIPKNIKINVPSEAKFCEVPYTVYPTNNEQKSVRNPEMCLSSVNAPLQRTTSHGWPTGSVNVRPTRAYGAPEMYPYQDYQNCTGPRPVVQRPNRTVPEDPGYIYGEPFYHQEGNIRYKPYPTPKERFPQQRYDFVSNYSNSFQPPSAFSSHKYDIQKPVPPHPYPSYPPIKYIDRTADPAMEGYQRNHQGNFNVPYRNQIIHPNFMPVLSNGPQNKMHSYPSDAHVKAIGPNKLPFDNAKPYVEYENGRPKMYQQSESYFVNEMSRMHPMKNQVIMSNYSSMNMHSIPPTQFYKKDNQQMKNYEYMQAHFRSMDPNLYNPMVRHPPVYSPNTLAISPADSSASNDTSQNLGTQEDCGYVSQTSTASARSMDSLINRLPNDYMRRYYDNRFIRNSSMMPRHENPNIGSKDKKNIDVRQFLQMWNEGDEESEDNVAKEIIIQTGPNSDSNFSKSHDTNQDQLYVLGLVNVPSEELDKYEHIQKVSKLPENIKGYNHIELLNQFEEAIESSNIKYKTSTKDYQMAPKVYSHNICAVAPRPLSPLDVEAKISQSVIHKEVGCNFEIKPCSPKMLNVEDATPVHNVLSERIIEKVANPVMLNSPRLIGVEENIDSNIMKRTEHRLNVNNDSSRIQSCKMANTQYSNNISMDTIKNSYSLQDLESNSGLCLASLPRLDNDMELNFPEVNQQFINANKRESTILTTSLKDLPNLEVLEQTDSQTKDKLQEKLINFENYNIKSPMLDSEKEFSKLSKYRKTKSHLSGSKEHLHILRKDSVIIKNPENIKNNEESANSLTNQVNEIQQVPINLTSQGNIIEISNSIPFNPKQRDMDKKIDLSIGIAIDFSLNKNISKSLGQKSDCGETNTITPSTTKLNEIILDKQINDLPVFSDSNETISNDCSNHTDESKNVSPQTNQIAISENTTEGENSTNSSVLGETLTKNEYLPSVPSDNEERGECMTPAECVKEQQNVPIDFDTPLLRTTLDSNEDDFMMDIDKDDAITNSFTDVINRETPPLKDVIESPKPHNKQFVRFVDTDQEEKRAVHHKVVSDLETRMNASKDADLHQLLNESTLKDAKYQSHDSISYNNQECIEPMVNSKSVSIDQKTESVFSLSSPNSTINNIKCKNHQQHIVREKSNFTLPISKSSPEPGKLKLTADCNIGVFSENNIVFDKNELVNDTASERTERGFFTNFSIPSLVSDQDSSSETTVQGDLNSELKTFNNVKHDYSEDSSNTIMPESPETTRVGESKLNYELKTSTVMSVKSDTSANTIKANSSDVNTHPSSYKLTTANSITDQRATSPNTIKLNPPDITINSEARSEMATVNAVIGAPISTLPKTMKSDSSDTDESFCELTTVNSRSDQIEDSPNIIEADSSDIIKIQPDFVLNTIDTVANDQSDDLSNAESDYKLTTVNTVISDESNTSSNTAIQDELKYRIHRPNDVPKSANPKITEQSNTLSKSIRPESSEKIIPDESNFELNAMNTAINDHSDTFLDSHDFSEEAIFRFQSSNSISAVMDDKNDSKTSNIMPHSSETITEDEKHFDFKTIETLTDDESDSSSSTTMSTSSETSIEDTSDFDTDEDIMKHHRDVLPKPLNQDSFDLNIDTVMDDRSHITTNTIKFNSLETTIQDEYHVNLNTIDSVMDGQRNDSSNAITSNSSETIIHDESHINLNTIDSVMDDQRDDSSNTITLNSSETIIQNESHIKLNTIDSVMDDQRDDSSNTITLNSSETIIQDESHINLNNIDSVMDDQRDDASNTITLNCSETIIQDESHINLNTIDSVMDDQPYDSSNTITLNSLERTIQDESHINMNTIDCVMDDQRDDSSNTFKLNSSDTTIQDEFHVNLNNIDSVMDDRRDDSLNTFKLNSSETTIQDECHVNLNNIDSVMVDQTDASSKVVTTDIISNLNLTSENTLVQKVGNNFDIRSITKLHKNNHEVNDIRDPTEDLFKKESDDTEHILDDERSKKTLLIQLNTHKIMDVPRNTPFLFYGSKKMYSPQIQNLLLFCDSSTTNKNINYYQKTHSSCTLTGNLSTCTEDRSQFRCSPEQASVCNEDKEEVSAPTVTNNICHVKNLESSDIDSHLQSNSCNNPKEENDCVEGNEPIIIHTQLNNEYLGHSSSFNDINLNATSNVGKISNNSINLENDELGMPFNLDETSRDSLTDVVEQQGEQRNINEEFSSKDEVPGQPYKSQLTSGSFGDQEKQSDCVEKICEQHDIPGDTLKTTCNYFESYKKTIGEYRNKLSCNDKSLELEHWDIQSNCNDELNDLYVGQPKNEDLDYDREILKQSDTSEQLQKQLDHTRTLDQSDRPCTGNIEDLEDVDTEIEFSLNEENNEQPSTNVQSAEHIFLKKNRQPLKRSLSDSALNASYRKNEHLQSESEEQVHLIWPFKRRKMNSVDNDILAQNLCNIIQSNRRNSISSIYTEDNLSFCILIDNSCIITEEDNEEPEKICYAELPEECLEEMQSDCSRDTDNTQTVLTSEYKNDCEYNDSYVMEDEGEKLEESWVEDIACVETVISDDIAEDIEIKAPLSPSEHELSESDESEIFSRSEHTEKVKYIYGDKMCSDDAHFVETLYNTPQMDVNKRLVQRDIIMPGQYYDNDSLEKLLSESNDPIPSERLPERKETLFSPRTIDVCQNVENKENVAIALATLESIANNFDILDTNIAKTDKENMKSSDFMKTQDDTVHSCESSVDNVLTYKESDENIKYKHFSSPEVSSTTSEEKNSAILLKITNYKGSRMSQITDVNKDKQRPSCKFTEKIDYVQSQTNFSSHRPLLTKAAQKYIPPLKETLRDLKVKLALPQHRLIKLKELKKSKDEPKLYKKNKQNVSVPASLKKSKPKFEDVLKSIDEIQFKMHKEKNKKSKKFIPKVVIKKNENGSHYASTSNQNEFNPDMTGRKWQPWVFIEKNSFIDTMAIKKKTKAMYNHRKQTYVLAEKFRKYKSIYNSKFVISPPSSNSISTGLKYTIRLKHD